MATDKTQLHGLKTAVHKPTGDSWWLLLNTLIVEQLTLQTWNFSDLEAFSFFITCATFSFIISLACFSAEPTSWDGIRGDRRTPGLSNWPSVLPAVREGQAYWKTDPEEDGGEFLGYDQLNLWLQFFFSQ